MAPSEARRDRWGRYLVVPPAGGRPIGYTRATTVAKALDDQGGLMPWKAAMALTGLMRRPGLRGQLEALISQHPESGPWYGGPEAKGAIKDLVEECAKAGGSADRADVGTALHAIVEQINAGGTPHITQESTAADVDAYLRTIRGAGIVFDPAYIECTFVLDAFKVAGTADMGRARIPGLGDVIADLKTGTNLDFSWQSIAVQLAIYAHGDAIYRQGDATDGSEDQRFPVPEVRQDVAVVIHLPAGEARCVLYQVDIAAGWQAFERSVWARAWRGRKDLAQPLAVARAAATTRDVQVGVARLLEVARRLPPDAAARVKAAWPAGAPALTTAAGWTDELLSKVSSLIVGEARACESPGATEDEAAGADPAADLVAPSAAGEEAASTSQAAAVPPGDSTTTLEQPITATEWDALPAEEQRRRILRGHLPVELRTPVEELDGYRARLEALTPAQRDWVTAQARLIDLPNLGHPHRWTIRNGEELVTLLDTAEQLDDDACRPRTYEWPIIVNAAGLTKAATLRQAKAIAAELDDGTKVGSKFETIPTSGPLADRLHGWIVSQADEVAA